MLSALSIQNYALISKLEIDFNKGFSVLTGETGAGKSIILGALSLILGQRADSKSIKQGKDKCIIEGVFDIASYDLESFFTEQSWEYDAQHCIIRREIHVSGKSRAFINDTPVALNDMKELVGRLIDVHSQHQNLLLGDDRFQMRVLDALTGQADLLSAYRQTYNRYVAAQKQLNVLKKEAENSRLEEDYLRYQYKQLDEAHLKTGEQTLLEQEIEMLSHVEEIKSKLFSVSQLLTNEEHGIVLQLKEALSATQSIQKIYPPAQETIERLESAYLDIKDLSTEIESREENMEYDPQRLSLLNERLDMLFSLQQKHRVRSVEELIAIRDDMEKKLSSIEHSEEQIAAREKEVETIYTQVLLFAGQISEIRRKTARQLEKDLTNKVSVLGMPNMQFSCRLEQKPQVDSYGLDAVTFLFSANKNVAMMPVSQIASGGEISRLMLGVKALIAGAMALPSIIFDEIDTGVSGEIADKMGDIMKALGTVMQVITITHLPQIAAKGDHHYFVYKNDTQDATETNIRLLSHDERIREIAQMLSGSNLTEAAIANAKELLTGI
ncbi:MAG: DNA repair protein RecN [Dysgonamonadaceae bacterium]|jgi:DNA repair protein RecN (Recombination protein N)|nr:DNA repair protein RecN [Dysgonamonadaceae bacterium]